MLKKAVNATEDAFFRSVYEIPNRWFAFKWTLATILGLSTCEMAARMAKSILIVL